MSLLVWIGFLVLIAALVALDLGVFHRRARVVGIREALAWTAFWVVLALVFNAFVFLLYERGLLGWDELPLHRVGGRQAALEFFLGYVVEKSLSLDNIFVIAMIFSFFRVPLEHQHRLLFWGILGAVVLRGVMIAFGAALISRFDWTIYLFGALLILSAARMLVIRHDTVEPDRNLFVRLARRAFPVDTSRDDGAFFSRIGGRRAVTPMFLALILVESSDVMFAVDSIPAIFAITRDPFLVFTSNIFAILGLRSLYFALAGLIERFRYLKTSLVFLLAYIGVKMLLSHHYPIPNVVSLAVIAGILSVGLVASLLRPAPDATVLRSPLRDQAELLASLTYRQGRRIVILLLGSTLMLIGIAMIVLPGPALVVIPLSLAILGLEFAWARRWLAALRRRGRKLLERQHAEPE